VSVRLSLAQGPCRYAKGPCPRSGCGNGASVWGPGWSMRYQEREHVNMPTHEDKCDTSATDWSPDTKAAGHGGSAHTQPRDARQHPLSTGDSITQESCHMSP
jgi:hypothetical protein